MIYICRSGTAWHMYRLAKDPFSMGIWYGLMVVTECGAFIPLNTINNPVKGFKSMLSLLHHLSICSTPLHSSFKVVFFFTTQYHPQSTYGLCPIMAKKLSYPFKRKQGREKIKEIWIINHVLLFLPPLYDL